MWKVTSWATRSGSAYRILNNVGIDQLYYYSHDVEKPSSQTKKAQSRAGRVTSRGCSPPPALWAWGKLGSAGGDQLVPCPQGERDSKIRAARFIDDFLSDPENWETHDRRKSRFESNVFDFVNLSVILAAGLHIYHNFHSLHPSPLDEKRPGPPSFLGKIFVDNTALWNLLRSRVFDQTRFVLGGTNDVIGFKDPAPLDETALANKLKKTGTRKQISETPPEKPAPPNSKGGDESEILTLEKAVVDFDQVNSESVAVFHNLYGLQALRRGAPGDAAKFFGAASRLGYPPATYNLGVCYEQGRGIAKDTTKAVELYKSAAAGGHEMAVSKLSKMCDGDGKKVS